MKFKVGDRVKQSHTLAFRIGTIVGIYEDDYYINHVPHGKILYASKGEYKVKFDADEGIAYTTLNGEHIEAYSE